MKLIIKKIEDDIQQNTNLKTLTLAWLSQRR